MDSKKINEQYDKLLESADITADEQAKLTDKQVDEIVEKMDNVMENDSFLKMVNDLPSNGGTTETKVDVAEEKVTVQINPMTGERTVIGKAEEESEEITDSFEDLWNEAAKSDHVEDIILQDENIRKSALNRFDFSIMEVDGFIKLIKEYKAGNTSNLYNRLPKSLQQFIDKGAIDSTASANINLKQLKSAKNTIAKDLIEDFISDVSFDQASVEFNTEMNKLFSNMDVEIKELYSESVQEKILQCDKIYEEMLKSEDEATRNRAPLILDVKASMIEARDLTNFKKSFLKNKIKKYDLERPDKIYERFDQKYVNSIYKSRSISLVPPIMKRIFAEYDKDIIERFVISFCKYCVNFNTSNMADHTFMYYFISNIIYLDAQPSDNDFECALRSNIKECLDMVKERYKSN